MYETRTRLQDKNGQQKIASHTQAYTVLQH